jgi:hypothetical protein
VSTEATDKVAVRQWIAIGVVAAVVAAAALVMPSTDVGASSGDAVATAQRSAAPPPKKDVERTPAKSNGANPFTTSVAVEPTTPTTTTTAPNATVSPAQVASSGLTTQDGSTPGLYGGTRNVASCNVEQLVSFLTSTPDKAQAWASVIGIQTTDIPVYIRGLTPVLLRADTAVTNHGFENGVATPIPSVLQAGTAVLVDQYGVPRVRCYCGNPLLPPQNVTPAYTGPSWPGFDQNGIVTVVPAPGPIVVIQLVDFGTGTPFDRPVGTDGKKDTDAKPTPTTTTTTPASRGPSGDPSGTYAATMGQATLTGPEELVTRDECEAIVEPGTTVNVEMSVRGRTIAIGDIGPQLLEGTYDPASGAFAASRPLPPPAPGVTQAQTMTGRFDDSGRFSATLTVTASPPATICTIPIEAELL